MARAKGDDTVGNMFKLTTEVTTSLPLLINCRSPLTAYLSPLSKSRVHTSVDASAAFAVGRKLGGSQALSIASRQKSDNLRVIDVQRVATILP
ncbi:hypothetical protein M9H77_26709 [Catharanthus roseus]|uniref:Uncharacterized protein n=1 Tax=Catharanthus roseus TaxID=4058 RepID=A0ACC0AEH4_CATRO|nr:hypothetical protein M9H77_26709 [Catharanthus roseus]